VTRISERFAEINKRIQLQIELAVRNALDKRDWKA
jgi:hypothetical protein